MPPPTVQSAQQQQEGSRGTPTFLPGAPPWRRLLFKCLGPFVERRTHSRCSRVCQKLQVLRRSTGNGGVGGSSCPACQGWRLMAAACWAHGPGPDPAGLLGRLCPGRSVSLAVQGPLSPALGSCSGPSRGTERQPRFLCSTCSPGDTSPAGSLASDGFSQGVNGTRNSTGGAGEEEESHRSYENTTLWLLSTLNCLLVALVFSKGKPFRQPAHQNCKGAEAGEGSRRPSPLGQAPPTP